MTAGQLVPDEMILALIQKELRARNWLPSSFASNAAASESANAVPRNEAATNISASNNASDNGSSRISESSDKKSSSSNSNANDGSKNPHTQTLPPSFILDGFPRTAAQASRLDDLAPINLAVELRTPAAVVAARVASRWLHAPSGRVYHAAFHPPRVPGRDDLTGEALTQRPDDDAAVWQTRFRRFESDARPLLDHYAQRGVLWTVEGESSDEITPRLLRKVEEVFG